MYCSKCGKVTYGNNELCESCQQAAGQTAVAPRLDMSGEGRGAAIGSIVLGIAGIILMAIAFACAAGNSVGGAVFFILGSLACLVLGIINGARGIKAFRRAGAMNATRPIASLICGIIGLCTAAIALIYWVIILAAVIGVASVSSSYYY